MSDKKDLVQIIRDNPGCVAQVDNDAWYLYAADGETLLADDSDTASLGGSGGYGSDLLVALGLIAGVRIEWV